MPKKDVITFKNGKELQVNLCQKYEKGKCGRPKLTPTIETTKEETTKKS